jgi:SAM-dependent methyltransferase
MLSPTEAKTFWAERAQKHKAQAVGFDAGINAKKNDAEYEERFKFIFSHLPSPVSLPTLDYGCGVGRYAPKFPNYVGADATGELLKIAQATYHHKAFYLIQGVYPNEEEVVIISAFSKPERVFTATVLQHCNDTLVLNIFRSLRPLSGTVKEFVLYEKDNRDSKPHVTSRTPHQYSELLVESGWMVKDCNHYSHIIHKEVHTLSQFIVG